MKNQKKISNPLTIIAIFAGLAEINGTVVLALVPADLQSIFLWFIILFPSVLILMFFAILNWNPSVLYAPSDFSDDESFLKILNKNTKVFKSVSVEIDESNFTERKELDEVVRKSDNLSFNKGPFHPETKKHVDKANKFFRKFQEIYSDLFESGLLSMLSFGAQAPEYFLLNFKINPEIMKGESGRSGDSVIIRLTENESGEIVMIALGKDIVESDHDKFAERMADYLQDFIDSYGDPKKIEKQKKRHITIDK